MSWEMALRLRASSRSHVATYVSRPNRSQISTTRRAASWAAATRAVRSARFELDARLLCMMRFTMSVCISPRR